MMTSRLTVSLSQPLTSSPPHLLTSLGQLQDYMRCTIHTIKSQPVCSSNWQVLSCGIKTMNLIFDPLKFHFHPCILSNFLCLCYVCVYVCRKTFRTYGWHGSYFHFYFIFPYLDHVGANICFFCLCWCKCKSRFWHFWSFFWENGH